MTGGHDEEVDEGIRRKRLFKGSHPRIQRNIASKIRSSHRVLLSF